MITPGSITAMAGLDTRPVYFVCLNGAAQPTLVVKGDTGGADVSIKWGSKLMKNVNNELVNTKIMTPVEINEFRQFGLATFAPNTRQRNNLGGAYTWVKMPMVQDLSTAGFVSDVAQPQAKEMRGMIAKLLKLAAWVDLGKVLAVDIFIGNNDRFQVLDAPGMQLGAWNNKGNLMFVGNTRVIGLDTFDPASDRSNLTAHGHFDALLILTDPGRRNAFAMACVMDVGNELRRACQRSGLTQFSIPADPPATPLPYKIIVANLPQLFVPYATSLAAGIAQGANDLKVYLQNKVRQYAPPPVRRVFIGVRPGLLPPPPPPPPKVLPQGILDRMTFLGWLPL